MKVHAAQFAEICTKQGLSEFLEVAGCADGTLAEVAHSIWPCVFSLASASSDFEDSCSSACTECTKQELSGFELAADIAHPNWPCVQLAEIVYPIWPYVFFLAGAFSGFEDSCSSTCKDYTTKGLSGFGAVADCVNRLAEIVHHI